MRLDLAVPLRRLARAAVLVLAALVPLAAAPASPAAAVTHPLALDVELDPAARRLQVQAELRPSGPGFEFALHESLTPSSATVDGRSVRLQPAGRQGALRAWRVAVPAGGVLRLAYGGTLPALDHSLDHRGVLQGLPPMAAEEGSFLAAGSGWYPQPAALFSYRVRVSVPDGQRALVAGRLVDESLPPQAGGRYRAHFEFPASADGIDLMAGPWTVRERVVARGDAEPLRLRTYFSAALDAMPGLADGYLDDSRRYIERYAAQIGPYPFTEFSVVAGPLPTGFGMPTLTYLGEQVLKLPFIRATSLGHEVLHNWWGNGVLVDYAQGNWSEGLTTFMADYAYKEDESAEAARAMRLGWLRDFAAVPAGQDRPLAAFRSRTHGAAAAVGYGKAAMVFVMLRDALGEEAFARGLRLFWQQHRFKVAGWAELQAAFEAAAGRPLQGFFAQWLQRAGGPTPRIENARLRQASDGALLTVAVAQPEAVHALRLPLELVHEDHSELRWIEVDGARTEVELAVDVPPRAVRLDPDLRVWRRPEAAQLPPILRQWTIARAPRLVLADEAVAEAAGVLAQRFFERAPTPLAPAALAQGTAQGTEPVLVVGRHAAIDAALASAGLPPRPAVLGGRGSAQVWTVQRTAGPPVAVVSVQDAAALAALARPLPHYGGQSWLVLDGGRVVERGIWPAPGTAVAVVPAGR